MDRFFIFCINSTKYGILSLMIKRVATKILVIIICFSVIYFSSVSTAFAQDKTRLVFLVDGKEVLNFCDENFEPNNHIEYEEIRDRGINGSAKDKSDAIKRQLEDGKTFKQAVLYCYPSMNKIVSQVIKNSYLAPKESEITFYPNERISFKITMEKDGKRVEASELYEKIANAVILGKDEVCVNTKEVKPVVTAKDNESLTFRRAIFSTDASNSSIERKHNIALALSKINGSVIEHGESFSFNEKVGKRSEENGFKTAKIIVDGEYVDGVGGGVCQASTTLYNCALLSDLSVSKVSGHSLRPSYVAPSFDAMVNSGSSDLVFKNETGGKVFIKSCFKNGRAVVEIYGKKNEYEIERKSVTTFVGEIPLDEIEEEETDIVEEIGMQKRVSYGQGVTKSEGYLVYYKNGKKTSEKLIRKDSYRKKAGKIIKKVESKKI